MAELTRFRRAYTKLLPWWLTAEDGAKVNYSLGLLMDAYLTRLLQGLRARWPSHAMPSALPFLGRDRRIVRGINESAESYAARLLRWLDDHRIRGNPYALMEQLRAYCQADVRIRTVDMRGNWYTIERDGTKSVSLQQGNWDWDGADASRWSRFWVIIYPTSDGLPWEARPVGWDDGDWWGDPSLTLGTTATANQASTVKSIVRDWQPDGTRCEWIIIAFDDTSFAPDDSSPPLPDGTWGKWGKLVSGNYEESRDETARYWKGVA